MTVFYLALHCLLLNMSGNLNPETNPKVICIDPGHPSENGSGTSGKHITELQAAWQVGLKLKSLLTSKGMKVVMTKSHENDVVVNRKRAEIANAAHADFTVRLHCESDGFFGFAVYYPSQQGTVAGVTGPSQAVIDASRAAARPFYEQMKASLKGSLRDRGLKTDIETRIGAKQGALTGSIFSKVPVVLVEMCVLSNAKDEAFIASEAGQSKMAEALAAGIQAALARPSKPK